MKTQTPHTPTPWTADKVDGKNIVRHNSEWIATLELGKNVATCKANAAYIVRAVNAYQPMVEAAIALTTAMLKGETIKQGHPLHVALMEAISHA